MVLMEVLFFTVSLGLNMLLILTPPMNTSPTSHDETATPWLYSTDTAMALQQRISRTIAEEVDELHPTLASPKICLSVSR